MRPAAITVRGLCFWRLGVPLADALGSGMGLAGGYSDGRDIGVVFNYPNPGGAHALPMCGGVGAQYTPAAGWAQAIAYKQKVLDEGPEDAIALVLGGDASCATGGFWSALTIATTQLCRCYIYVEDNGYGISVPSEYQTPGKDIAANLASFSGLTIFNGDGTDPVEAARLIEEAVGHVRKKRAPALLRLTVPRLEGHSFQDTQTYKCEAEVEAEWARDPLPKLKAHCAKRQIGEEAWADLERETAWQVEAARAEAEARGVSSPETGYGQRLLRRRDAAGRRPRGPQPRRDDRPAAARRPADQHGHRDPPRARPGARGQSARAGVRRGCRAEGRRPCGDARPAGEVRPRAGVRHQPQRGGHRRPRGRHGARRPDARARNPVPQICRAGDRADPRLRDDALAHQQPLRRADGAARAGRLLQVRRPVAFDDQRGRVRAQSRLEGRGAVQRRGRGRAAAR